MVTGTPLRLHRAVTFEATAEQWSDLRRWLAEEAPATAWEPASVTPWPPSWPAVPALQAWFERVTVGLPLPSGKEFFSLARAEAEWRRAINARPSEQGAGPDGPPEAGTSASRYQNEFLPLASYGGADRLVFDARPGPLHGCVSTYFIEVPSFVPAPEFTSLHGLLSDLLTALRHGAPFMGCQAAVDASGRLDWVYEG